MLGPLTDARGVTVQLDAPPRRIVSLVPSTTETLFALGLGQRVVGVTRFCVRPEGVLDGIDKVGGTKDVIPERVAALEPDLILGNCEENSREIFAALDGVAPLWAPLPKDVDTALQDLLHVGTLCGVQAAAQDLHDRIQQARAHAREAAARRGPVRYAWLIWRRPYMVCGGDTFTSALLSELGGVNVFAASEARFPEVTPADLRAADPDRILLSSEPFPFKDKHAVELAEGTGLPRARCAFVDGQLGTWHGVRLLDAFARWTELLPAG